MTFFLSTRYSFVSFTLYCFQVLTITKTATHNTTGFCMSLRLIPLGKYKEARLPKDTVCLVFSNADRLSSQVAQPSFVLTNDAVLATPRFYLHLIWLLESQQCRTAHTHICHGCFFETGFHYVLLVRLATSCTWLSVIL